MLFRGISGSRFLMPLILMGFWLISPYAKSETVFVAAKYDNEPLSYQVGSEMKGIAYDVFLDICKELELPFTVAKVGPLPWKRVLLYLKNNKIDVLLGGEKLGHIDKSFIFSKYPLYQTSYSVFYRKEDRISMGQLPSLVGAVLNDVDRSILTNEIGASLTLSESYSRDQNILKLRNRRVNYFLAPLLPTLNFISEKKQKAREKIAFLKDPVALSSNYLVFAPKSKLLPFKDKIDQKLKALQQSKVVEAKIGETIATWNAFDWYLENATNGDH